MISAQETTFNQDYFLSLDSIATAKFAVQQEIMKAAIEKKRSCN